MKISVRLQSIRGGKQVSVSLTDTTLIGTDPNMMLNSLIAMPCGKFESFKLVGCTKSIVCPKRERRDGNDAGKVERVLSAVASKNEYGVVTFLAERLS